ncbi:hypothetical protein JCM6292_2121 [Bacteroides pyogenes JCM 6292]|uniref:Uncharacterized protein n=2 Tax=Bacteroides pyogenes TaxID=310300 RepID=W4PDJ3_9BACE|nr:hypothetical protein [Bacteroides pyogenes]GAE15790.1 hypothetical protein JCM6292_2121 [Bacteroides pyogenes JCM 6292]GAE17790.1 hypothetical protein JCM6294_586 [Bacteroides pyogenes DSM 20611 = JCM 6294]
MKKEIVLDANNPYVRGLMKAINEFILEETGGCIFTERRLMKNIDELKREFGNERDRMVISGSVPMFSTPRPDDFEIIFAF